ncbi:GSCFA domain-containing protein [Crocinitomix catalasitica]|nr:GSCFA domain-containing protein [Crocinitomix catalasitica]
MKTEVKIESTIEIRDASLIVSLGSCFAENIGALMHKRNILVNPHGILFNPFSLERAIEAALNNTIREDHYGVFQEDHFHFDYHSKMNGKSRKEVAEKIARASLLLSQKLQTADFLFITFGTAWVWQLIETETVVANCHKVPQDRFRKGMLNFGQIIADWVERIEDLLKRNPKLQIVVSVSPVRHTRNGLPEDKISKSYLLILCDSISKHFDSVHYFPAYEIVLDELRDYAYFKDDLIHPTDEAIGIVYEKFKVFSGI